MNSSAVIMISAGIFVAWLALAAIWCTIDAKKYKKYIDSIKIGDKFVRRESFYEDLNPFEKRSEPRVVEIIDIKTNKIGEKYVQYRYIDDNYARDTKIDIFVELFRKTF